MEQHEHIDVGEGMTYCKKHRCWWQAGDHCDKCEVENISRCVAIENAANAETANLEVEE